MVRTTVIGNFYMLGNFKLAHISLKQTASLYLPLNWMKLAEVGWSRLEWAGVGWRGLEWRSVAKTWSAGRVDVLADIT